MKTITINVSDPVYQSFKQHAKANDRTASELIREAMERYRDEVIARKNSILSLAPISLGRVIVPLGEDDDLLDEMLND
jgi:predicted CopG family antitoxin